MQLLHKTQTVRTLHRKYNVLFFKYVLGLKLIKHYLCKNNACSLREIFQMPIFI